MIRIRDLSFTYGEGEFGLDVPSLDIAPRERVACIGPSGTGKTTLINLIAGILLPDAGEIELDGKPISSLDDSARRNCRISTIGMVFQQFELLGYLTAEDNILLPYHVSKLTLTADVRERAHRLAESMGLGHTLRRGPDHLSQGERQRVAICRALVTEPRLVICDEPTGNLDPATAETALDLLFRQIDERDATLVMVTHNHQILDRFDRIVDMDELVRRDAS